MVPVTIKPSHNFWYTNLYDEIIALLNKPTEYKWAEIIEHKGKLTSDSISLIFCRIVAILTDLWLWFCVYKHWNIVINNEKFTMLAKK